MRIGTTPTYTFKIPAEMCNMVKVKITFKQNGSVILEKYLKDCVLEKNIIKVRLTQEDTFLFSANASGEVQLRMQLPDATTLASNIYTFAVEPCLDSEVL